MTEKLNQQMGYNPQVQYTALHMADVWDAIVVGTFVVTRRSCASLHAQHSVGAGVEGSSAALFLAKKGFTVENTAGLTDSQPDAETVPAHLSHDPATNEKRTDPFQFGQRYLSEQDDVFEYNAWDHVVPDDAHYEYCEAQYAAQRAAPVSDFDRARFNDTPEKWWDLFYKQKTSTFFK